MIITAKINNATINPERNASITLIALRRFDNWSKLHFRPFHVSNQNKVIISAHKKSNNT